MGVINTTISSRRRRNGEEEASINRLSPTTTRRLLSPLISANESVADGRRLRHFCWRPRLCRHCPLLLLIIFSAVVCPSHGQHVVPVPSVPWPNGAFVPTDAAAAVAAASVADDASVAAIVDARPVEVRPAATAELTVDGSTDEQSLLSNNGVSGGGGGKLNALPTSGAAGVSRRAWTKRLKYAAATHLATPSGIASGGGTMPMLFVPTHSSKTERRRKPPAAAPAGDKSEQHQRHDEAAATAAAEDEQQHGGGRRAQEAAADDQSAAADLSEAGTARLVAMEDVDRDDLSQAAAAATKATPGAEHSSTASEGDDDSPLITTVSSSSPAALTVPTGGFDGPFLSVGQSSSSLSPSTLSALSVTPSSAFDDLAQPPASSPAVFNNDETTTTTSVPSLSTVPTTTTAAAGDDDNSSSSVVGAPSSPNLAAPSSPSATVPRVIVPKNLSSSKEKTLAWPAASQVAPRQSADDGTADDVADADGDGGNTHAVGELDLKSDRDLAKLMRRTTMRMRDYPTEVPNTSRATTTSNPLVVAAQLAASQAPSLFPGVLSGVGGPFAFPPPAPLPATTHSAAASSPSSAAAAAASSYRSGSQQQQQQSSRRHGPLRADQFEPIGCYWDLITLSCKDVFRVGWCESCADFGGSPFLHDCRCTAVTGLYVQTASFLGSSAAAARANAALTANQTTGTGSMAAPAAGVPPPVLPMLPLLPTLAQLGTPLEATGGAAHAGTTLPRASTAELQQQLLFANALHFPAQPVPIVPSTVPSAGANGVGGFGTPVGGGTQPVQQQQQQQQQDQQQIYHGGQQQQQRWDDGGGMTAPFLLASPIQRRRSASDQQRQFANNNPRGAGAATTALFGPQRLAAAVPPNFTTLKRMMRKRRK